MKDADARRNPTPKGRTVRRRLLGAAIIAGYLVPLGIAGLGLIFGPVLLGKPAPTEDAPSTNPPVYEVVLLDLGLIGGCFAILWLVATADAAVTRRTRGTPKKTVRRFSALSKSPVRSMPLWIAGNCLLFLAVAMFVVGFQEGLLAAGHDTVMWIVDPAIGFCGLPVGWYGGLMRKAAKRPSRFGDRTAPGGTAVSRRAAITGGVLYAVCWLARLLGVVVAVLGALMVGTTVSAPGDGRPAVFEALVIELAITVAGVSAFRGGSLAKNAARRRFGLATPMSARTGLPWTGRMKYWLLRVAGVIVLALAAAMTVGGIRLAPDDLLRSPSAAGRGGGSSSQRALEDIAIAAFGFAILWLVVFFIRRTRTAGAAASDGAPRPNRYQVRGWVLRVIGWAMRFSGVVILLLSVLGVRSTSSIAKIFGHGLPWYALTVIFITSGTIGAVVLRLATLPAMRANRYLANVIASNRHLSPGSYVLYLRPFYQDTEAAGHIPGKRQQNFFNNPGSWIMQSDRSHEERLAALFSEFGPLLAVGSPGEQVPGGAGALRMYLPLDNWKGTVGDLIDNARLIVLGTGPGPGTLWEYAEVLRRSDPTKLVLLVTDPIDYKRFKASSIAEIEGVLHELKSRYGESWEAPLLPDLPDYSVSADDRALWFRAMVYFTDDCEPHLVSLNRSRVSGNFRLDNEVVKNILTPLIDHLRGDQVLYVPQEWV